MKSGVSIVRKSSGVGTHLNTQRASALAQVIYVEAISNPLLEMADLEGIAAFARQHGLTHVIDNTFATPVLLRPASLGFIVIHSATKYLNGHSDVLAGVVSGPAAFIQKVRAQLLHLMQSSCGMH